MIKISEDTNDEFVEVNKDDLGTEVYAREHAESHTEYRVVAFGHTIDGAQAAEVVLLGLMQSMRSVYAHTIDGFPVTAT
ncbi:hypothetical protein E2562_016022 [Oryza meyeriana var. granulata]|uniref:Uncharacterized protein n=1 Tax=Oryza meyeriana var. granulata TaxID=110450 RepID=A0A6G1EKH4_9ORYZ|nr:hypothetical protein E2562_016022 [Oryza meyeriana var. granulata]